MRRLAAFGQLSLQKASAKTDCSCGLSRDKKGAEETILHRYAAPA
jgi:hypothetical protein